eukprot:1117235-Amphidinium_carterae.1
MEASMRAKAGQKTMMGGVQKCLRPKTSDTCANRRLAMRFDSPHGLLCERVRTVQNKLGCMVVL